MDAKTFLDNFGVIAEAPNGVAKLRELVLQLAVQGKLVEQNPKDGSAADLLLLIDALRERSGQRNRRANSAVDAALPEQGEPFALPPSWRWVRMGRLARAQPGYAFKSRCFNEAALGVPLVRIRDIRQDRTQVYYDGAYSDEFLLAHGDQLIGMDGDFNVSIWRGGKALLNQRVCRLLYFHDELEKTFFGAALQHRLNEVQGTRSYTTVQHLSGKQVEAAFVPLPPLPEQHRIVAKVDELMALCDELEARQQRRNTVRRSMQVSVLQALTEAESPEELKRAWERVKGNWDLVTGHVASVSGLRELVLQLAMKGQLVEQDPEDEPAEKLVSRLGTPPATGELPRRQVEDDAHPSAVRAARRFSIPKSWTWTSIHELFEVVGGIQKTPQRQPRSNAYSYLRVANVQRGRLDLNELASFELADGELNRWRLEPADLLIVEGNGSREEIGRCALWSGELADCVHQNHIIRCRPAMRDLSKFVLLFLNSPSGVAEMQRLAVTTSGLYNLSVGKIRGIEFPLPPLSEQHRIVAKVSELMARCDELDRVLRLEEEVSMRLTSSAVVTLSA